MLDRRIMGKTAKLSIIASLASLLLLFQWNYYTNTGNDIEEADVDSWISVQEERKQLLRRVCAERNLVKPLEEAFRTWTKDFLFSVDEVHKVLVYRAPKVASSSWSHIIAHSSGVDVKPDPRMEATKWCKSLLLTSFSKEEQLHRLRDYRTILFVRHPYDRLVSAFLNKFHNPTRNLIQRYRKSFGSKIANLYRSNVTDPGPKGFNITFEELARYITDGNYIDEHFELISRFALPCSFRYDFIGHYENLLQDSYMILERVNISVDGFPWDNKSKNSRDRVHEFFSSLDTGLRKKLYDKFRLDFELFGYQDDIP